MPDLHDQQYLREHQYKDSSNLGARIQLHVRFSANPYGWLRWVFDQFEVPPDSHILELGCGRGDLWVGNRSRIPDSWEITLSDFSPGMLDDARRHLGDLHRRFKFRVIDAQAIPFDDAMFDAVIANHMLFHVPDRPSALSEIRRVLKPGGRFYASTVGPTHLREMFELASRFDPSRRSLSADNPFNLENGLAQVSRWFSDVTVHRYPDSLAVTEAAPLVDAVLSTPRSREAAWLRDKRDAFIQFVEAELAARGGVIHVTKDSGLFKARRPALE